jgi:hypothetical protein
MFVSTKQLKDTLVYGTSTGYRFKGLFFFFFNIDLKYSMLEGFGTLF